MKPQERLPCLSANVSWLQLPDPDLNKWLRKCMDGWIDPHRFSICPTLLFPLDLFICTQHKCEEVIATDLYLMQSVKAISMYSPILGRDFANLF